ncbi:restriction endonuclease subunit S [Acinetobacter baumannii]|nr:restriction endonuclease subunit S [Acinetobacter baumannii]MDH2647061.1 restriction endonuclease subunit S [Acinetobacter baumannii]
MAVPKLRFKEFDADYTNTTFEKLKGFSIQSGKSEEKGDTGEFPFYGSTGVIGYKDIFDYEGKSILIARVGANAGSLYQIDGKYSVSDNTLRLTVSDDTSLDYLRELLIKFNLNRLVFGTGQPLVTGGMIKKVNIFIPEFTEQTKIASFLSNVDEKISQLNQKHELLSQYKQGMMQKLFSQQIRFKADDGSEFGEWKKVKFSDKFKFHQTNSYSRALLSEQGEIMNIHYGDIHTKFSTLFDISKEVVPFLSSEVNTNKFAEDQFLQVGDLVIADASEDYKDIGKALEIIHLNNQKVVAGLHTYIARPVQPFALGFCGYLMQTFEVREQIKKLATGISVLGISKTNIGKVEIKVPCLEEQTKIANFLSAIDQKIEVVAQQIEQAKQWKKGLLQQMFV